MPYEMEVLVVLVQSVDEIEVLVALVQSVMDVQFQLVHNLIHCLPDLYQALVG
jgi:hypothetical protein